MADDPDEKMTLHDAMDKDTGRLNPQPLEQLRLRM